MKNIVKAVLAVILIAAAMCFTACGGEKKGSEVTPTLARSLMEDYLVDKGFEKDSDFLSEENTMMIDDVKVYVFSWRTPAGENADRLFGMYAVSVDGKDFYEYQSGRNEWIHDMDS